MGKKAFIATVTCLAAAVCTTTGAQSNTWGSPLSPKEVKGGAVVSISTRPVTAPGLSHQLPLGPLGGGGAGHDPLCVDCGPISFTQSTDPVTITDFNSVACNAAQITLENSYYRGFTLADHGVPSPFEVCGVQIGIQTCTGGMGAGAQPITIRLYDTADPTLANAGNLVGEVITTIADQALSLECFLIAGTVTSGGLTVEIFIPDGFADGNIFFIGSNALPETGLSYIRMPACVFLVPTPTAAIGFPDMHIVMTVFGAAVEKVCPEDTNGDLLVNVLDLIDVLLCFGLPADPPCDEGQDINQDGVINVLDLIDVLLAFGTECPPQNVLEIVCDQGLQRPGQPNCCDFSWTVTNNGPQPIDAFWLDLEAGVTNHPIRCRTIGLPGWIATQCYPWDDNAQSNWSVWEFTGGVLLPGESKSGGTLNVEVNQQVGGSNVLIPNWIPFFVPQMAIHCHVTSVGPGAQTPPVVCVPGNGTFGPHIDLDTNGAPDQDWSTFGNWVCSPKDVCEGAEVITLSNPPVAETVSGVNNTTLGSAIDPDAPVCLDQLAAGNPPVEILAGGNWYSVIGNGATLTATTCNSFGPKDTRLNYDSAISVYGGGCGNLTCIGNFGANTDAGPLCITLGGLSTDGSAVTWCSQEGLEYLILVHGALAGFEGTYQLDIISDGIVCSLCDPGKTPEGEIDCFDEYVDNFNGGCNSTPEIFLPIACGQAYCGTYGNFILTDPVDGPVNTKDRDWYQITTVVNTVFTWTVTGECETLLGVLDGSLGCANPGFLESTVVPASVRGTVVTQCLGPGIWWFFVAPANLTGCDCGSQYTATLTCVECVSTLDQCEGREDIFDGLTPFDTTGMNTDGPGHASCQNDGQTYHDIWYNYTATCTGLLTITTCEELGGSADYDTDLVVYDGCDCGVGLEDPPLGCNDDDLVFDCGDAPDFHSTVSVLVAEGNCYKIRVGGFQNGFFGPGELLVTCIPECPLVCDPLAGKTPEGEPDCFDAPVGDPEAGYVDIFNGGCNSTPEVFGTVAGDEQICGRYGTFLIDISGPGGVGPPDGILDQLRDTDWYAITTVGNNIFTWRVTGQCPTELFVVEASPAPECFMLLEQASFMACETGTLVTDCLPAGTYYFIVGPAVFAGCACGSEYNATLVCEPGCVPPANDVCGGAQAITCPGTDTFFISDGYTSGGVGLDPTSTCEDDAGGPFPHDASVWYEFTATTTTATVTMCGFDETEDSVMTVFTNTSTCGALVEFDCDDDLACAVPPDFGTPEVALGGLTVGETYLILIDFYTDGHTDGPHTITITCP